MGIAKNIQAYSVCNFYTTNIDIFIKNLSDKLNADFLINIYDEEYYKIGNENTETNFNKPNKYRLTITLDEYNIQNNVFIFPTYELTLPINFDYGESINLDFYPNNSVHIMFLTFEHLWKSFIDELKFEVTYNSDYSREHYISRYKTLQQEYTNILRSLDIEQILITTHAYYSVEDITDSQKYPKIIFEDILKVAIEKDKALIFDFKKLLNVSKRNQLNNTFLTKDELKIMLLDEL